MKVGAEFTLALEANPTTGYQWQLAQPLDASLVQRFPFGLSLAAAREPWMFLVFTNVILLIVGVAQMLRKK